ncbi:uncharacterized protein [Euwallacea similis]|uniref:uncharacterized protein n=1 Tax=Euwallacea similis TaxID=1736056 RepID=UPI00344B4AC7
MRAIVCIIDVWRLKWQIYIIVNLPFNDKRDQLGNSNQMHMEYTKFIQECEHLGHMSRLSQQQIKEANNGFYLPHHAIIKEQSTTIKLRVVFDGSIVTISGLFLNDVQHAEYEIQIDVKQMYRQIWVPKENKCYQRIVWRPDDTQPIQIFELNTVTYGTRLGAYLAKRCLRQIGKENKEAHPNNSEVIINDFYVDDLLTGINIIDTAQELRQKSNKDPKTLGLKWKTNTDELLITISPREKRKITKRSILSQVAQIFDPLGLIAPITVHGKIILQRFTYNLEGDSTRVHYLYNIQIPRRVLGDQIIRLELHGFSNASERAFGACIYLRSTDKNQNHTIQLLCAKSRVAPLNMSILRLKLSAALLLAQLASEASIGEIQRLTNDNWAHVTSENNPADLVSCSVDPMQISNSIL